MVISDILDVVPGSRLVRGAPSASVLGVARDSRRVAKGDVFVAVPGHREDGARYVEEALARGAAAVVSEKELDLPPDVPLVLVKDARSALAGIAAIAHGHPSRSLWVTGITGTNGKTTTSYLLRSIYRNAGLRAGLVGTVEFDSGRGTVPSTATTPDPVELQRLLRSMVENGARGAILEVSSHALVQRRVEGVEFRVGVFTNLTREHLDYHGDLASYEAAKEILFRGLDPSAVAVLNAGDPVSLRFARSTRARVVTYGIGDGALGAAGTTNATVRGRVVSESLSGTTFVLAADGAESKISISLPGRHNVENALAAAAAALAVGIDRRAVIAGLEAFDRVPGRLDPVDLGQGFKVFVDYAHTDDALRKVLAALRPLVPGRILVVFGCGGDRDRGKRPRMGRAVEELADLFWVTNDNPRGEDPSSIAEMILSGLESRKRARVVLDRERAIAEAIGEAREGDAVLVAGKGHECGQIFRERTLPFDDREVAAAAVRSAMSRATRRPGLAHREMSA